MQGTAQFEELAQTIRLRSYNKAYYALTAAYMDESFDPSRSGVFAVGGYMGRGIPLFELDRKWDILRKRPGIDIAYFKASQCERGTGEFAKFVADPQNITTSERGRLDSISREFLSVIAKEAVIVHGIGVIQDDFYDVTQDPKAREILGQSPYRLTYDLAMIQCAWAMKELEKSLHEREYVSFVCDECEQHSLLSGEAYRNLKTKNPNAAEYMATYSTMDDKICGAMQAADAVAFEIRRMLNIALGQWKVHLRRQFSILSDARKVYIVQHANKKNLLEIVNAHKPGEPYKLDIIMEQVFDEDIQIQI